MLLAVAVAALFRFWRLGSWPPGLYRDEAYYALDALDVLAGKLAVFFPANNGREPIFIYLVAASIALFGATALAGRLVAATAGALATIPTYLLANAWFGRLAGLLAAFLWAITFWSVHLGRIGMRVGLLPPALALAFWAGTRAYRDGRAGSWFLAGLLYGLTFYTYLAARVTPLLMALLVAYLLLTGRRKPLWSDGRVLWAVLAAALVVAPLGVVALGDPALILGRAGQVSVFNPEVNGGDLIGTLAGQTGRALGMFIWRGDPILRHNALLSYDAILPQDGPAGRPVFDWLMAGPFLIGVLWCLRHWRRAPAMALLLWQLVMLLPTILAEDTPHFLRSAGLLPGTVFLPAIGLAAIWNWGRAPRLLRQGTVVLLLAGSAFLTIRDYSVYARQPDVGYLFETAAADLARSATAEPAATTVYLDRRFVDGWPSVLYLLGDRPVTLFDEGEALPPFNGPAAVYIWPYAPLDPLRAAVTGGAVAPAATVSLSEGPLARGDLEPEAYPLYLRVGVAPGAAAATRADNFKDEFILSDAAVTALAPAALAVDLTWALPAGAPPPAALPTAFLQVVGPGGVVGQSDAPPGGGRWPVEWWEAGLQIRERRIVALSEPFDPAQHQIITGLYWPETGERLPVLDAGYNEVDDKVALPPPGGTD